MYPKVVKQQKETKLNEMQKTRPGVRTGNEAGPANRHKGTYRSVSSSRFEDFAYVVIPPDGGFGWVIVVASFLCQMLTDGTMYTFGIFLKEIAVSLNCTESQVTLSSSIQNSCYNISGTLKMFFFTNLTQSQ